MAWYREILALHVIAVISWMAGILYLYRLLVYATEQGYEKPDVFSLLKTMTRRLWQAITVPAMVVSWGAGLSMVWLQPSLLSLPWMQVKLLCVVLLTIATLYAGRLVSRYQREGALPTSKTLRFLNEGPTLFMIFIVYMVIVRPFS